MKSFYYILVLCLFFSCGDAATNNENSTSSFSTIGSSSSSIAKSAKADIKANIEYMTGETKAYLAGMFAGKQYVLDSADVNGTVIQFTSATPYQGGMTFIWLPNSQTSIQLLLGDDQEFSVTTKIGTIIDDMKVEGNIDNELFYQNLRFQRAQQTQRDALSSQMGQVQDKTSTAYLDLKKQQDDLNEQRKNHLNETFTAHPNSFFTSFKRSGQNPTARDVRKTDGSVDDQKQVYFYRTEFWDNVNFEDERLLYTPVIKNKVERYMTKLTAQNADSIKASADHLLSKVLNKQAYYKYFANWIALQFEPGKAPIMDPEAVYVHMVNNYFTYDRAFWADSTEIYALQLRASEMAYSLVGQTAQMVTSRDQNGKTVSMNDIKSKYLVVFMYNPTCDHCIEQAPQLVNLYRKWKPKGLEVFAIALDTEQAVWKSFIQQQNMTFTNVFDPTNESIYSKYYVNNTPEVYLMDENRTIFAKNIKVNQIEEAIGIHERKQQGVIN